MKIKNVKINAKKKALDIEVGGGKTYSLPFAKLPKRPTAQNPLIEAYVDSELAHQGVTLTYKNKHEESVPLDAFLDYNRDPSYMRDLALHDLTLKACKYFEKSGLSKHEVMRRLGTSASQLYRLLDPAYYSKSIDEMMRLLAVLGCSVEWKVGAPEAA